MAVATGQADVCVVYRSICQGKLPFGQAMARASRLPPAFSWAAPYGLMAPGQMFALAAVRHMHLYGTTEEHFSRIAINARDMAAENPQARFREPLSADEYFSMPYIYEPLRRPDLCNAGPSGTRIVAGLCALLARRSRAAALDPALRGLRSPPPPAHTGVLRLRVAGHRLARGGRDGAGLLLRVDPPTHR